MASRTTVPAEGEDTPVPQRLLAVATRLFAERGYDRTSVQEIVEAAGVTKGALYHYFGSKDDLLHEVYARMLRLQQQRLDAVADSGAPVEERLRTAADLIGRLKYQPNGQRSELAQAIAEAGNCSVPDDLMMTDAQVRELRLIADHRAYSEKVCAEMLEILLDQQYRSGIPAGLPKAARVAHKTGNISTVHHDAGIVYLDGRKPYVLVILTSFPAEQGRGTAVAEVSRDIFNTLAGSIYE